MHEAIIETNAAGQRLAEASKLFPLPSSGGYDRLHKSWRKSVTGLDKTKTDGYSLRGDFLNDGAMYFNPGLYVACAYRGSVKNQRPYYALYKLTQDGDVEKLADVESSKTWAIKLWPVIEAYFAEVAEIAAAAAEPVDWTAARPHDATESELIDALAKLIKARTPIRALLVMQSALLECDILHAPLVGWDDGKGYVSSLLK